MPADALDTDSPLAQLGRLIGETVLVEMRRSSVYIHQSESPLGRNRHIAAVRRRLAENPEDVDAAQVDKSYYLTPKGLQQELKRFAMSKGPRKIVPAAPESVRNDAGSKLLADLRRQRGT